MPTAQQEEIAIALDAVYECIDTGDDLAAVITGEGDGRRGRVRVTRDRLELTWPYGKEATATLLADLGRYLRPLDLAACRPRETLVLAYGLPRLKVLTAVLDQVLARVLKLGDGYEVGFSIEPA